MTEEGNPLEKLIDEAERPRRFASELRNQSAANDLCQYAEELEAEIRRRTIREPDQ